MAENAVPGKGMLAFGKKADSSYAPLSLASDGSVNISGSITASLGAFNPLGKAVRSVSTGSANVALPTADKGLVLINTGANDCFFKLGSSGAVTAAVTDFLLKSGCILGLDATGFTHIAAITATGSTSIDIWTGTGLISAAQAGGSGGGGGNVNLNQVGGASIALGQAAMAASLPVALSSDQSNLPANIKQVNGATLSLGQTTKSASLPVALASDTGALPITVSDRLEVTGSSSAAAVLSNFPVTDTSGYRSLVLQVTNLAAASTLLVEESNDGTTWSTLTSGGGLSSITAAGLYGYNFSAKQIRVRQSVYGGAGTTTAVAELRLAAIPHDYAIGAPADAQATDATSSWSVIAMLKGIWTKLGTTLTVSGSVTANAGTNLNTSALAVESGGHLAAIDTVQGAVADAAWTSGSGSVIALLKAIAAKIIATVAVTQSGTWTVQPGNTPNTAAWLIGHGKTIKTVPVSISADGDLVALVSTKRIKVIAYALFKTGTGANPINIRTNNVTGAILAKILLQSQASAVFGANLAIAAPSFLFATAAGEALYADVGDTDVITGFITYFDDDAT